MVRDGADPDVAVFLQVLGGDDCRENGLSDGGNPPSLGKSRVPPGDVPTPLRAPACPRTFAKRDAVQVAALEEAGLDGAGLRGEQPVLPAGAVSPSSPSRRVPRPVTCGMVFIRLYLCTSSSFEGIRCCPFPIPAEETGGGCQTPADVGTHGDTCHRRGRPLWVLPNPGNPLKVGAVASGA